LGTKSAKFLLCENPIVTGDAAGRIFILHNREPLILAEVLHFQNLDDAKRMEIQGAMDIGSRLDRPPETIFFVAQWARPSELFYGLGTQEQADQLAGIMRRMADWYQAYLNWKDSQ